MKLYLRAIGFVVFTLFSGVASAYELTTHGAMTRAAVEKSVLNDAVFRVDLGIPEGKNPFGEVYYDVAGSVAQERRVSGAFEGLIIEDALKTDPLSLTGWLLRGAIREDDIPWPIGSNPQDDPHGNIWRVFNHFYDPIYNRPLTVLTGFGETAPNWAVGSTNALTASPVPNTGRRNHFTVFDAREAMYRALTGRDASGSVVSATEDERNKYWATAFRALGDIVHLLQDMGQPQHTRNEAHCGASFSIPVPACGHKSVYEAYIEVRATGGVFATPSGSSVSANGLQFDGYPIPPFNNYTSFFTTRHLDAGEFDRSGLADYSNRGFFTAGKNLGHGEYAYPPSNPSFFTPETLSTDWVGNPLPNGATVTMLNGIVSDTVDPSKSQMARLTTQGLWDQFLESKGFWPSYTLNRYNYDAMADLLIPRAVAYSAGIINYFFRGKLDFVADTNNAGAYLIKNLGPEAMSGDFTLYYDAADGKRYPVPGDQPTKTWAGRTIAKNGQLGNLSFSVPANPAPEVPGKYMLVFNGDMGEEKAIPGSTVGAVAAKYVEPERSGFLIQPNFATADGITGPRHIYWDGAQWKLSKEKGLLAGNVDWKGWYVNGKPTKVLSWMGSSTRYGVEESVGGASGPDIYQNGRLHAVAPCTVLGAALRKDASGKGQIVAVCTDNTAYTRSDERNSSSALYDAQKNPKGWKSLAVAGDYVGKIAYGSPWFFNGTGTEAQRIVKVFDAPVGQEKKKVRLKLTLGEQIASVANLGGLSGVTFTRTETCVTDQTSDTRTHVGGNLLAVDYLDGQEVVAELRNDRSSVGNAEWTGGETNVLTVKSTDTILGGEIIKSALGIIEINTTTLSMSINAEKVIANAGPAITITLAVALTQHKVQNKVDYVDLRTTTYIGANKATDYSLGGNDSCTYPNGNFNECLLVGSLAYTDSESLKLFHQGGEAASVVKYLFQEAKPGGFDGYVPPFYGGIQCGYSVQTEQAFQGYPIHGMREYNGSAAVAASGAVVVSWPHPQDGKVLNFLTGGDFSNLFAAAQVESSYRVIGVVR